MTASLSQTPIVTITGLWERRRTPLRATVGLRR